jgi:hypothetical protein
VRLDIFDGTSNAASFHSVIVTLNPVFPGDLFPGQYARQTIFLEEKLVIGAPGGVRIEIPKGWYRCIGYDPDYFFYEDPGQALPPVQGGAKNALGGICISKDDGRMAVFIPSDDPAGGGGRVPVTFWAARSKTTFRGYLAFGLPRTAAPKWEMDFP